MSKTIKMELSSSSIKDTIKKLKQFQKEMNKADEEIVEQLANLGLEEIQKNYANTPFKDGNDDIGFFKTGSAKRKSVGVAGSQVLYNEFGTGTEGANNPHPEKDNYGLNSYNSGRTIRKNNKNDSNATQNGIPVGELYWTYNSDGQKIYTQGIPAGQQVYKAAKVIQEKKKEISKKVVGDALSKL